MVLLLPLLVLSRTASAAVPADEVDGRSLPGYGRPFLDTRHYSGYIRTYYPGLEKVKVYTHYHLVRHLSSWRR